MDYICRWIILVVAIPCVAAASIGRSATFNANIDFAPNSPNPNGMWTYGYTTSLGSPLIRFTEYVSTSSGYAWRTNLASGAPAFIHFTTNLAGILAGETSLHGGPSGEYSVLRFTTPWTTTYDILVSWRGPGDTGETSLHLLRNSDTASPLGFTNFTTTTGAISLIHLPLNAGDTIDLALGTAGAFTGDNTPVNLIISGTAPDFLAADFVEDGDVDDGDFARWSMNFGASGAATHMQGDADDDRDADGRDFLIWQEQYGLPGLAATAVPEPSCITLIALTALGAMSAGGLRVFRTPA